MMQELIVQERLQTLEREIDKHRNIREALAGAGQSPRRNRALRQWLGRHLIASGRYLLTEA